MNLSLYKNNIFIAMLMLFFQCYSFNNFSLFLDWSIYCIGIEAILVYLVAYKKIPAFTICIPLLIPWVYLFKVFHYCGYLLVILEMLVIVYLIHDLYTIYQFKARKQWILLLTLASYCFVNNLWAIVLDQIVVWFINPEKTVYLTISKVFIKEKLSLSFFPLVIYSNNQVINHFVTPLFHLVLIVKSSICLLWGISWGALYCLATLSHHNKIFSLHAGGKLSYGWWDKVLFLLCFVYSLYHGWYYGGFTWVGFGIFCNEILILFLMTSWLLVISNILYDLKIIQSFSLLLILSIPFIIQHTNIFNIIHLWLSQYNFYSYKNHINSSLYMAFSVTFLSWFLWIVPIILILYLFFINKQKLSLGSFVSIIGACIFTLSIWSLHHFFATQIVNNSEELRQESFNTLLLNQNKHSNKVSPIINNSNIATISSTDDINQLIIQLDHCKVCHIFPDQKIDHTKVYTMLNSSPPGQFINLIPYNIRLVNIMKYSNTIYYNIHRPSEITFISLTIYCIIYFPLFFFWLCLSILLQVMHRKYFIQQVVTPITNN